MKSRALALILLAALAACGQRSEQDLLAAARKHLEQKDAAGAAIELKNLLQQNPDSVQGRLWLGKALLEGGDMAGAEIELRRAQELGAPRDELIPLLAETLLNSGQSHKVIGEFGDQSLADPQAMSGLQQQLALAYLSQGNVPDAKVAAARALQLTPDAEGAVIVNARTKLAANLPDEALAALDELLTRNPKAAKALLLKAEVLLASGKPEAAEPVLSRVLEVEPGSYDARSLLVRLAFGRQKLDVATRLVAEMPPGLAKKPQGRFLQAQLALAKGDAAKARELALPLLKLMPNYLPLLRLASGAHQQLGELADAENLLNQALKLAPTDLALRRQYASLQLQRRAPAKTLEALRPLLDSGKADAESLLLAGKAQLMQGNFEAADQAFAAAAKLRPDDPKTSAALALSVIARDTVGGGASKAKADAALNQLRDIAAKDTAGSNYDLMLINALTRRGDLPAALAAIDKLAPKMQGSPVPDGLRGRIDLARKDTAAAQAAFEAALKADAGYLPAVLGLVAIDIQAGRNDAAIKRLEGFVASQAHAPQARLALAELLLQTKAPPERVTEVLAAGVRAEPTEAGLRLALIDQKLRLGDTAGAAQAAQEAAAALPQNPDLLERLARTQLASGNRGQAGKTYTQLTALAPSRATGWLGLAQLRFIEQDYAGAEREVKRALEAEPASVVSQRMLIQLAVRQGHVDEALAALHERQKKNPQEAYALIAEADIEAGRQHFDAAIAALRKAAALREPNDAAPRLFAMLLAAKKRDEALAFETQWQAAHPQDAGFAVAAADVTLARGDMDGALTRYEALLKRSPDAIPFINNVAWLRSKAGKPGARELAERGLKLKPDDSALRDTYATVLANDKDFAKAVGVQRQLVSDQPDQPMYRLNLAQILIQSGDKAAAKVELDGLAKLGAKFPQQKQVEALLKTL
ncbi:XrtA/PEP-CTERM system TPR-repeat protein PrsT [Roseateles saccharophilus]|uniref:Putative PEP-CTERM system TPR-repeat lipoprotein n=1 Tax=Roseateles saccharophilus TaxID=304 RepID=A0A4R3V2Q5_ROSSA|nr:XrtA/PEP-CTERM system TPR-repeat protein PrsT [Roseateles saccharophilus]MDG0831870.1 PEP-CTERM system TPR-repeat protein PrsT [Roseateles saccharophilus]TCU97467.1 putative PEP-CTERM system TPR-repeat lipoprotein [Roseateles saccharophilus]